ncbi:DNA-binding proteins Bright/BRCAA1/RBP1 and proteins containing BRIGHT domain [Elasticomyces elasticus]|nr:DNA-binding proteins Bright/BRCAA1/RBP1 and proteins containing BRIGHT domain [Elasticomyces elasticus]
MAWLDRTDTAAHMKMTGLNYKPLIPSRNEIRLLRVQPNADHDAEIVCTLDNAILEDGLAYHALSYTWGDLSNPLSIQVDGHALPITRNLHAALLTLRCSTGEVLTIWVDAICINQASLKEKSCQIPLMRNIYHYASEVAIWLGPAEDNDADDNTDLAFDALDQICRWEPDDHFYFGVLSLAKVLDRLWWKRVWTMQEVVVARNAVVYCGARSAPWESFTKLRQVMRERAFTNAARVAFNDVRNEVLQSLQKSDFIYATDMAESYQAGRRMQLGDLFLASGSRQAKEPHDHVYALLGIASDAASIRPDYTQPVQIVFTRALRTVVNVQPLFLDFLQLGDLVERKPGLPSWYIDFAGERKKSRIGALLQGCATGNISATRFSDDGLKLTVGGWQIDQIEYVGRYVRDGPQAEHDLSAPRPPPVLHEWLQHIQANPDCVHRYGDASSLLAGFYLSLTAGTDLSSGSISYTGLGRTPKTSWHSVSSAVKQSAEAWFAATELQGRKQNGENDEMWKAEFIVNFGASKLFRHCALQHLRDRAFIVTKGGFIGVAPNDACAGDVVALVLGAGTPVLLRPSEATVGAYEWVGAAWVAGIMSGEMYEAKMQGGSKVEYFDVV